MGGEIDEGRHIGLVRTAALAGSPISFFGVGGCNFASFSPPTGAVEARRHEPKNHRERFGLCFVYQQYDNHGVSGGLSIVTTIRRIFVESNAALFEVHALFSSARTII